MQCTARTLLLVVLGVLGAMVVCSLVPTAALGQQPGAKIISIEGAATQYKVIGKDGQVVEVDVPAQSPAAIQTESPASASMGSPAGQKRTVSATVASITSQTNPPQTFLVKVVTTLGQIVTLEMPAATAAGVQIGDKITLQLP